MGEHLIRSTAFRLASIINSSSGGSGSMLDRMDMETAVEPVLDELHALLRKSEHSTGVGLRDLVFLPVLALIYNKRCSRRMIERCFGVLVLVMRTCSQPVAGDDALRLLKIGQFGLLRAYPHLAPSAMEAFQQGEDSSSLPPSAVTAPSFSSSEELVISACDHLAMVFDRLQRSGAIDASFELRTVISNIMWMLQETFDAETRSKPVCLALLNVVLNICIFGASSRDFPLVYLPGLFSKLVKALRQGVSRGGRVYALCFSIMEVLLCSVFRDDVCKDLLPLETAGGGSSAAAVLDRLRSLAAAKHELSFDPESVAPVRAPPSETDSQSLSEQARIVLFPKRSAEWFDTSRRNVQDGLSAVLSVILEFSSAKARRAQLEMVHSLVSKCRRSLSACFPCMLELVLFRRLDVDPDVSGNAVMLFESIALTDSDTNLLNSFLAQTVHDRCKRLPHFLRSFVDDASLQAELKTIAAYVDLGPAISHFSIDTIRQSLYQLYCLDSVAHGAFAFLRGLSADVANSLCRSLGSKDAGHHLVSDLLDHIKLSRTTSHLVPLVLALRYVVDGSSMDAVSALRVLSVLFDDIFCLRWMSHSVQSFKELSLSESSFEILLQSVFNITCALARACGQSFLGLPIRLCLFKVLAKICDSNMKVRAVALETLRVIAVSVRSSAPSPAVDPTMTLLSSHMALIVDALARQMKHPALYPEAPMVLEGTLRAVLKARSFQWMMSFLQDSLELVLEDVAVVEPQHNVARVSMMITAVEVLHECFLANQKCQPVPTPAEVQRNPMAEVLNENAPVPRELAFVSRILEKVPDLLVVEHITLRVSTMMLIQKCCIALTSFPLECNPRLHKLWPHICRCVSADAPLPVQKAAIHLLSFLVQHHGGFLASRMQKEILPMMEAVMAGKRRLADSASTKFKSQLTRRDIVSITERGDRIIPSARTRNADPLIVDDKESAERILNDSLALVMHLVRAPSFAHVLRTGVYSLCVSLRIHLDKSDAREIMKLLARIDAGSVWLSLYEIAARHTWLPPADAPASWESVSSTGSDRNAFDLLQWMETSELQQQRQC
eukprot:ANDGO_05482.mRNA.1 hypothetical protein